MSEMSWTTTIEDAGDGSGDGILTLPPELSEIKGWTEGTVLHIETKDGCLYIYDKKDLTDSQ
jgi:hypothetical protein